MAVKLDKGLVTFFDVEECGFYRTKRNEKNEFIAGTQKQIIKRVYSWVKARHSFECTSPVATDNKNKSYIYCKHVTFDKETGDALFVFWKSNPESDGKLNGVYADSKVNDNSTDTHKLGLKVNNKKVIPGQPMYYWFMPNENLLASIKFEDSAAETSEVAKYIRNCINLRIPNKYKKESESPRYNAKLDKEIIVKKTMMSIRVGKERFNISFSLKTKVKQIKVGVFKTNNIEKLAKKITHVVVRDTISTKQENVGSALFKKINSLFGGKNEAERSKHIEYISEEQLTGDSLQAIINEYETNEIFKDKWYDIGFRTEESGNQTLWFSAHRASEYVRIDQSLKKGDSYYRSDDLLAILADQKPEMLMRFADVLAAKDSMVDNEKEVVNA